MYISLQVLRKQLVPGAEPGLSRAVAKCYYKRLSYWKSTPVYNGNQTTGPKVPLALFGTIVVVKALDKIRVAKIVKFAEDEDEDKLEMLRGELTSEAETLRLPGA